MVDFEAMKKLPRFKIIEPPPHISLQELWKGHKEYEMIPGTKIFTVTRKDILQAVRYCRISKMPTASWLLRNMLGEEERKMLANAEKMTEEESLQYRPIYINYQNSQDIAYPKPLTLELPITRKNMGGPRDG